MRVASIDLGKVRVGLALSDELGMLAHPRPFLDGANMAALFNTLVQLSVDEGVERFIVGLPRMLDGREGPPARRARRFAEILGGRTGKPVELVDEWLTTREASSRLRAGGLDARKARQRIDSASAAVLLQAWLDRKGNGR
jgi:putative holliday junction resolvase